MKYLYVFVVLFAVFVLFTSAQVAEQSAEIICRQPMIRGRCRALIPRFFYNVTKGECEGFGFGGCGGNDNNFESLAACQAKCNGITAA